MWTAVTLAIGFVTGGVATLIGVLFFAVAIEDPDDKSKRDRRPTIAVSTKPPTIDSQFANLTSVKDVTYH